MQSLPHDSVDSDRSNIKGRGWGHISPNSPQMAEQDRNIYDSSGRQVFIATQLADWTRSDEYHNSYLISPDPDLRGAAERNRAKGLDDIAVSEAQGKFLYLLAKSINASKILEVGTLGG